MKTTFFGLASGLLILAMFFINATSRTTGYAVGDKARDFSLKNTDGKMVSLAGLSNAKGAIIIFSCNHCPYVVKYEDRMISLGKKYGSKGYPVVAINSNDVVQSPEDSYENMIKRHKKKKYSFDYVFDESQEIAKAYGAEKTPHVYVLQKNGSDFVVRYIGAIDDSPNDPKAVKEKYVENAVDALLSGKDVPVATTKAIGCSIKWKK
jgi:peroxiredoxin